jgi:hypothetical protein
LRAKLEEVAVLFLDKFLWVGEDGDDVGLGVGVGSLAGFELAVEDDGR